MGFIENLAVAQLAKKFYVHKNPPFDYPEPIESFLQFGLPIGRSSRVGFLPFRFND
jgi:hypothetical protein